MPLNNGITLVVQSEKWKVKDEVGEKHKFFWFGQENDLKSLHNQSSLKFFQAHILAIDKIFANLMIESKTFYIDMHKWNRREMNNWQSK